MSRIKDIFKALKYTKSELILIWIKKYKNIKNFISKIEIQKYI